MKTYATLIVARGLATRRRRRSISRGGPRGRGGGGSGEGGGDATRRVFVDYEQMGKTRTNWVSRNPSELSELEIATNTVVDALFGHADLTVSFPSELSKQPVPHRTVCGLSRSLGKMVFIEEKPLSPGQHTLWRSHSSMMESSSLFWTLAHHRQTLIGRLYALMV